MATSVKYKSPGTRLQLGASVLTAAKAVDTRLVKDRLQLFEHVHRSYASAQKKVDTAEGSLDAAQRRLAELDQLQDEALEKLACTVATDGAPRKTPFESLGAPPPNKIMRLPFAEEAAAIHQLVVLVLRSKTASEATIKAAKAVDKAASIVEEAIVPIAKLENAVRDARHLRDTVAQKWESAYAALRRGTRAAADEGGPELDGLLFPPIVRPVTKKKAQEEQPAPAVQQAPPATPAPTPAAA
jgi:hypothetical protein